MKTELIEFIKSHDVDYSYNRVDASFLPEMERTLGVTMGEQLKEYVLQYGYLGYSYIELFGVNRAQGEGSDMIRKTRFLHEHFPATKALIALEDQGDGDYYLVDQNDEVYRYLDGSKSLTATDLDLSGYVLQRFLSI